MKPPEPFTWFIDRSLGAKIAVELRAAGFVIEEHAPRFTANAPDTEWLGEAGRRGWVVLTKDKAIRRNELEVKAIVTSEVSCFSLGNGNLKGAQMAEAFIVARQRMEKALRRFDPPMTASVTTSGQVRVLMANGVLLEQPKSIK